MTGLYLFVGLGLGFGLIGAVCGWALCRWHHRVDGDIRRQIDRMARSDWQREILRESATHHLPDVWERTR